MIRIWIVEKTRNLVRKRKNGGLHRVHGYGGKRFRYYWSSRKRS